MHSIYCPLCDRELDWSYGNKRTITSISPTLDRINNENFINKNNVWIVCNRCNAMKSNLPLEEYIAYCEHISKNKEKLLKYK